MTGTMVLVSSNAKRRCFLIIIAIASLGWCVVEYFWEPVKSLNSTLAMSIPADLKFPCELRDPSSLIEVSSLKDPDVERCAEWLDRNGKTPTDYVVEKAAVHRVVLLGEMHEQKDTLQWFNEIIPILHKRSGVTCVAMEVCLAQDNDAIQRLVTGEKFDRELAAEIARHQWYGMWGWKEYWDVLETVWRVNRQIAPGEKKIRLIGLDKPMDAFAIMAIGVGGPVKDLPFWEKLRAWRLPQALALMMMRDGAMAREIEQEVFEKGERAIVLVGAMHSTAGCRQPGREQWGQMGSMLRQRHPNQVFQIRMHQMDISMSMAAENREDIEPPPGVAAFLERVMAKRDHAPVGFDVTESPMAVFRDSGTFEYHNQANMGLADIAMGYIYLKDWKKIQHCTWQPGYISPAMFVENKPIYQALARRDGKYISSAVDMNEFFANMK